MFINEKRRNDFFPMELRLHWDIAASAARLQTNRPPQIHLIHPKPISVVRTRPLLVPYARPGTWCRMCQRISMDENRHAPPMQR